MKRLALIPFLLLFLVSCESVTQEEQVEKATIDATVDVPQNRIQLSREEANRLAKLPLACIDVQYPNKLNQVIDGQEDLQSPEALHPAFYGCFDWHSAVHGHWSLVKLAKTYPELKEFEKAISGLETHLTKENIQNEIKYFEEATSQGFERMYGWAWLLKLADELNSWDHPRAKVLSDNLKPLADLIAQRCMDFLPKLHYPIRVGTHTNTAFAMCMIYDYAITMGDEELAQLVEQRARDFYLNDEGCPITWEPSGYDFLSPCLEEANIMRRVLEKEEFESWLDKFLPQMADPGFTIEPGIVSDRTDGHLVHLDGVNFSRAWCLNGIAETLPKKYGHLTAIANKHIQYSLPQIVDGNYEGGHWLASFALLSLTD